MPSTDLFIAGAGPAGLAAGIAARRRGLRVTIADARTPPIDKACGEGLMPDALAAARILGLEVPRELGMAFHGIRFAGAGGQVEAIFPEGHGLGICRRALHLWLVERALESGVDIRWGTVVQGDRIDARWIVGADGTQSSIRRRAGLENFSRRTVRYGFRRHYASAPQTSFVEIHWGPRCQFYITPVAASQTCLVLTTSDPRLRIDDALPLFPELLRRFSGVPVHLADRGALSATSRLARVSKGNVALVGDASGTVDAVTGDGICLAFKQAVALADALAAGDLNPYERAHRRIARRPRFMADFMLLMDRNPRLQSRALAALSRQPQLFANLLAMHVGKLSLLDFALTSTALGWRVATAL